MSGHGILGVGGGGGGKELVNLQMDPAIFAVALAAGVNQVAAYYIA